MATADATDLQDLRLLLEDAHRRLDLAVELARPGDAAGDRRQVARRHRLVALLLVQLAHQVEVAAVVREHAHVLVAQVEFWAADRLHFEQQLQRLLHLRRGRTVTGVGGGDLFVCAGHIDFWKIQGWGTFLCARAISISGKYRGGEPFLCAGHINFWKIQGWGTFFVCGPCRFLENTGVGNLFVCAGVSISGKYRGGGSYGNRGGGNLESNDLNELNQLRSSLAWSRFYESSQAMPTYRSYFD